MTTAIERTPNEYAIPEQLRNAELSDLVELLKDHRSRSIDRVVPATKLAVMDGLIVVEGSEAELTDDGVTPVDGVYRPTSAFDAQLAKALNIDLRYLRRCREQRPDIYDAQVNAWLHGSQPYAARHRQGGPDDPRAQGEWMQDYPPMDRKWLLRLLRGGDTDGVHGVARAMLSSKYRKIDNYDVMLAVLKGISQARHEDDTPVQAEVASVDLTETRMQMRVAAPDVRIHTPELMRGYRSPFEGNAAVRVGNGGWLKPAERIGLKVGDPICFAGFSLRNSDLGHGRFSLAPVVVALACANGMTITTEAQERVHLGSELDEGNVEWSSETHKKFLELIERQTVDAVSQWLTKPYLAEQVAELEKFAGVPVSKPEDTVKFVAQQCGFTDGEADEILKHFYMGGQLTAGGIMQAVSSVAQTVQDGEAARNLELAAVKAGKLAASRG